MSPREFFKVALYCVCVVIFACALGFIFEGSNFFLYKFFAPKQEQVRREVFEQTHSYKEGMQQEIQSMAFQYVQADDEHKAALGNMILHKVADFDISYFSPDLQAFVRHLRSNQLGVH